MVKDFVQKVWQCIVYITLCFYDFLITKPLRIFYFEGPVWKSQPSEEICFQMTGVESKFWSNNMRQCQVEMERHFRSWDRTVLTVMYFSILTFVVIRVLYWLTGSRNIHQCHCTMPGNLCDSRLVTREELARLFSNSQNNMLQ